MTDEAFRERLRAIFGEEAREHLAQIDVGLVALEQAGGGQRDALFERLLKVLHTLKGAARTVDEIELERLCHALESMLGAARAAGLSATAEQFDLLHRAAAAARQVVDAPALRSRKVAGLLAGQLETAAAELPAQAAEAPLPDEAPAPEGQNEPDAPPDETEPNRTDGRIRVDGRCIDSIRAHAEGLLPVELKLRHHVDELRALAAGIATRRREGVASFDAEGARLELACAQLATGLENTGKELHGVRARLFEAVLETALVPAAAAFGELPALVRNLARGRGKQVRLDTLGADVDLDRRVLGVVREALIHLVTNAVDHGIETPDERTRAGKDPSGRIEIAVTQRDARMVCVCVRDDGAGIDADAVARRAGVDAAELAQMSEQQRLQLALRAGVSTRTEVTSVSGRGVGLAIVADKVAASGGQLVVGTVPGAGASFELLLPVGVASLRALVVEVAGHRYALPLAGLEAVRSAAQAAVRTVEGRETVLVGGRVLPLVRLAALFGTARPGNDADQGVVIAAQAGGQAFGVLVDAIVAEQDLLPKPMGPLLRRVRWFSGAAQLGDGTLAPVIALEDAGAAALAGRGLAGAAAAAAPAPAAGPRKVLVVEDSVTSRLLLKHILEGAGYAVDTAVDGLDAQSRLRTGRYDVVVSDVEMPNMDGLALTASIRATPATAELPVILVTSLQTPEQREAGLRVGADAYFTKGSFDQDRLLATVRRVAGMEAS
ncbi:response regulator [Massilia cellulosiltytica]|uniref:hybrid sensor histidine kinase/response regulator n=1 Tax=Massilia cellulosiltytica TaxID=2683234 RepID=UPI0039B61292